MIDLFNAESKKHMGPYFKDKYQEARPLQSFFTSIAVSLKENKDASIITLNEPQTTSASSSYSATEAAASSACSISIDVINGIDFFDTILQNLDKRIPNSTVNTPSLNSAEQTFKIVQNAIDVIIRTNQSPSDKILKQDLANRCRRDRRRRLHR